MPTFRWACRGAGGGSGRIFCLGFLFLPLRRLRREAGCSSSGKSSRGLNWCKRDISPERASARGQNRQAEVPPHPSSQQLPSSWLLAEPRNDRGHGTRPPRRQQCQAGMLSGSLRTVCMRSQPYLRGPMPGHSFLVLGWVKEAEGSPVCRTGGSAVRAGKEAIGMETMAFPGNNYLGRGSWSSSSSLGAPRALGRA